MPLEVSDFGRFFKSVHGCPPFKWQSELASRVCKQGWPEALDMPTSTGKTAVIDIAVFHLAMEARRKDRKAPVRIAFVVDRRLVVDGAFEHANKIADKLTDKDLESGDSVVKEVAESLKSMSSSNSPLDVVKMRGGMPHENDWAKTPSQPLVIVSTVDQIGSRFLFRGYGVSASMRPIHAGLIGSDMLLLLDEAHTSQPFLDTLKCIDRIRQEQWKQSLRRPFAVMFMSATLPLEQEGVFPSKERRQELLEKDDSIRKRIDAHKYVKMHKINTDQDYANEFVQAAFRIAAQEKAKSVGIVVNRVLLARDIFAKIKTRIKDDTESYDAHLLIGRSRPFDRDTFVKSKIEQIKSGGGILDGQTVFFVTTQCIEVGVDVSFDALVTQIAPLDSLHQRFGRLNRIGLRDASNAIIIAHKDEISDKTDDYIYKKTAANTWKYLEDLARQSKGKIDFGIQHFEKPEAEKLSELVAPRSDSVTVLPTYMHFWMQTNPSPSPDPDPALFLHGMNSKSADVQVIWRADVTEDFKCYEKTFVSPPSSLEAISIPIGTAKKWLAESRDMDVSDIESGYQIRETISKQLAESRDMDVSDIKGNTESFSSNPKSDRHVLRWRGIRNSDTHTIKSKDIRPGDTIIVPATYGGCDTYGWDDQRKEPVKDIGMEANLIHRRQISMRFDEAVMKGVGSLKAWVPVKRATINHADDENLVEFLEEIERIEGLPELWKNISVILKKDTDRHRKRSFEIERVIENGTPRIAGFRYKKKFKAAQIKKILAGERDYENKCRCVDSEDADARAFTEEEDVGANNGNLVKHCTGVRNFVKMFGKQIGLDRKIQQDIELAAWLHDAGKAERRVQAFLKGVDPDELSDRVKDDELVAKSTHKITSKEDYYKYLRMAHLPKNYRHECWSVSLAERHPDLKKANDPKLVMYLIGTHHGYGRPLFPPIIDDACEYSEFSFDGSTGMSDYTMARLDTDWINMVEDLYKAYDPWELAYMESIIRLADHRQSALEERDD